MEKEKTETGVIDGMNIYDAIIASKDAKMKRSEWKEWYIYTPKNETKPHLVIGKGDFAYQPSIEDVMATDWIKVEDK